MDRFINRYIAVIVYINDKRHNLKIKKENIIYSLKGIEKRNSSDFLFPIYCYIDESRRNMGVDSNLVYMEYGIVCFGNEFDKRKSQKMMYKLTVLYELISLFRENNTHGRCDYKELKKLFKYSKVKSMIVEVFYYIMMAVILLTFISTQFYMGYVL